MFRKNWASNASSSALHLRHKRQDGMDWRLGEGTVVHIDHWGQMPLSRGCLGCSRSHVVEEPVCEPSLPHSPVFHFLYQLRLSDLTWVF